MENERLGPVWLQELFKLENILYQQCEPHADAGNLKSKFKFFCITCLTYGCEICMEEHKNHEVLSLKRASNIPSVDATIIGSKLDPSGVWIYKINDSYVYGFFGRPHPNPSSKYPCCLGCQRELKGKDSPCEWDQFVARANAGRVYCSFKCKHKCIENGSDKQSTLAAPVNYEPSELTLEMVKWVNHIKQIKLKAKNVSSGDDSDEEDHAPRRKKKQCSDKYSVPPRLKSSNHEKLGESSGAKGDQDQVASYKRKKPDNDEEDHVPSCKRNKSSVLLRPKSENHENLGESSGAKGDQDHVSSYKSKRPDSDEEEPVPSCKRNKSSGKYSVPQRPKSGNHGKLGESSGAKGHPVHAPSYKRKKSDGKGSVTRENGSTQRHDLPCKHQRKQAHPCRAPLF